MYSGRKAYRSISDLGRVSGMSLATLQTVGIYNINVIIGDMILE